MYVCVALINIIVILILLLLLSYFKQCYVYWEKRGVYVSSKPKLIFGNALPLLLKKIPTRDVFNEIYDDCQRKLKKMSGFYFFGKPCLVVADLALAKTILKTDFEYFTDRIFHNHESDPLSEHIVSLKGRKWKMLRAQLSPAFTVAKTRKMFPIIEKQVDQFVDILQPFNKGPAEFHNLTNRYTMDAIGNCVFGVDCNSQTNPNSEFYYYANRFFNTSLMGSFILMFALFLPEALKLLKLRSITTDIGDFFLRMVSENIKFREENNIVREDLMHLLIQLRNNGEIDENEIGLLRNENQTKLTFTEENITAQCIIFFMAGYETSATTLSFCLYELSVNQDIQEKARLDVIKTLAKHNSIFSYDAVHEMEYIEKCIKETLRKYSPPPVHLRECTKQYPIRGTNIVIEKGTPIFIPHHGFQMDPKIFPNPDIFDPERFAAENSFNRHPSAWMPFGFGPRMCIGTKLAMTVMKTCLAKLLMNFKFTPNHLTDVPIAISSRSVVTFPKNGIWLNVTKIQDKNS